MEAIAIATELDGRPGRYRGFEEQRDVLLPGLVLALSRTGSAWYLNKGLFSSATRKRGVLFSYHGVRGRGA